MQAPKAEPVEPALPPAPLASTSSSLATSSVDKKEASSDEVKSEPGWMQALKGLKKEEVDVTIGTSSAAAAATPYLPTPPPGSASGHPSPAQVEGQAAAAPAAHSAEGFTPTDNQAGAEPGEDAGVESDDSLSSADSEIARNAFPSPRRNILFDDDDATFPSKAKFVSETKKRLYRTYGVTAWVNQNDTRHILLRCSQLTQGCGFRVRAERQQDGAEWSLVPGRCLWVHNHDMEGDEEERASWSSSEDEPDDGGSEEGEEEPSNQGGPSRKAAAGQPWSAPTKSALMKRLVADRARIFALQNRLRPSGRQGQSANVVDDHLRKLSESNSVPRSAFSNYCRFAKANRVPPFPLTPAILALWFYDKCSTSDGYFNTYKRCLENIMELEGLQEVWANQQTYKQLRDLDPGSVAINEFIKERNPSAGTRQRPKASTSASPKKKRTRAIKSAAIVLSSDEDDTREHDDDEYRSSASEHASATSGDESGDESEPAVQQGSSRDIHVPGLPAASDSFASTTEAFKAYVKALVPVYGISVTKCAVSSTVTQIKCNRHHPHYSDHPGGVCSWQAVLKLNPKTKRWSIDADKSHFKHSHGPCKEILRDSSFRPTVRNPDAREALGMPPLDGSVGAKVQDKIDVTSTKGKGDKEKGKEKKRERVKERNANERKGGTSKSKGKERAGDVSPPTKKRRLPEDTTREPPPPAASIPPAPSDHAYPQPQAGPSMFHSVHVYQPPTFTQTPPYPRPAPTPQPAANYVPSLDPLPTSDVSAFLHGLHPSLEPLAPHFIATGFTTIDALASLALLDPAMIDHTLALMRTRAEAASTQSQHAPALPSVIQLRLLAKSLKEAGRA